MEMRTVAAQGNVKGMPDDMCRVLRRDVRGEQAGEIQLERWGLCSSKYVRRDHLQTAADFHRKWKKASFDLPL
jgi:hypothetical protein